MADIDYLIKDKVRETIIECRKEKGITQTQLGDYLGKSKTTVASWEQGKSNPDIEMLYRMSKYFNKTISQMYGEEK